MEFFLRALVSLVTIIDPIGQVPIVLALTAPLAPEVRGSIITRAVVTAAVVIAVFGLAGRAVLRALGATPAAFSVAGGALLFLVAVDMLFGRQSGARETERETSEASGKQDISVFPLAIPMIAGPGTLTTIILLVDSAHGSPVHLGAVAVAALLTLAATWTTMRVGLLILRRIGTTGVLVLSRVLGMLLAAVAAQFILNGINAFLHGSPGP